MADAGVLRGGAVAIHGEAIVAVGPQDELLRKFDGARHVDCAGRVVTPGLVDSHTHSVFGRARYEEQEMRAAGAGYMEIARRGGGIHSSVRDLRSRTEDELFALALDRTRRLASYGSTTVEMKSGYGLSVDDELKSLRVIARVAEAVPARIIATWLGAHEIPVEYRERARGRAEYVKLLTEEILPIVAKDRLATFADVFCEPGVFSLDETRAILTASHRAGLGSSFTPTSSSPTAAPSLPLSSGPYRPTIWGRYPTTACALSLDPPRWPRCFRAPCSFSVGTSRRRRAR